MLVFAVDVVGYLLQHEAITLLPQGKPHGSPFQNSGNKFSGTCCRWVTTDATEFEGGGTLPSKRPNGECHRSRFGDKVKCFFATVGARSN